MKNKVEFTPPSELISQVGANIPDGTNVELMVNFRSKGDKWCIAAVEGVPFPGYDAQGNPEAEDRGYREDGNQFAERYGKEMTPDA